MQILICDAAYNSAVQAVLLCYIIIIHTLGRPPHCLTRKEFRKDWCRMRLLPCYDSAIRCSQGMNIRVRQPGPANKPQRAASLAAIMSSSVNINTKTEDCFEWVRALSDCFMFPLPRLMWACMLQTALVCNHYHHQIWPPSDRGFVLYEEDLRWESTKGKMAQLAVWARGLCLNPNN